MNALDEDGIPVPASSLDELLRDEPDPIAPIRPVGLRQNP